MAAAAAAAAASPSSLSSSSNCLSGNSSIPRLRRPYLNLHFCNDPPVPRLVSVRSQAPNVDGLGSKRPAGSDYQETSSSSSAIDFLTLCHSLKACIFPTTKRKGWINHGIKGPESIADHMYRMALMALIAGDLSGVNRERCIKIAIVHDIAEAIVGDITPSDGVPKAEKSRREQAALDEMCKVLGGGMRAEEIQELWAEYENNSSIEANLVKDFDKVEMILQALEYEMGKFLVTLVVPTVQYVLHSNSKVTSEHGKVLDEFFLSTAGKFQTEIGKKWAAEINSRRKSLLETRSN
ncbi:hypothetical protein RJ640_017862 [Escallonia rubra]|uniref:5'-deoxynucleotidase n=1 Tax=Escallonia rubra TaxID=112253 RepID=A0AA88UQG4_9ASTE|nr:hypothetical protein RJ640_017862 [Escallonia rubra]